MSIKENISEVFDIEISALIQVKNQISQDFINAIELIAASKGKLIVTGMGKSGHIGKKIAATLSSTGTTSVFMHPAEAIHGDLGMIEQNDIVLGISFSGETDEILKLIPSLNRLGVPLISITGNTKSTLANNSKYTINISVEKEACPLALAPTSSTTATLVVGDAIAISLMKHKNFQAKDFAIFHPGGSLGRKLLCKVSDEMKKHNLPLVMSYSNISEVIMKISEGMIGLAIVCNENNLLLGVITDGDLRRAMQSYQQNIFNLKASDIMTSDPKTISKEVLIGDAENLMMEGNVNSLIVTENDIVIGVLAQRTIKYN